LLEKAHELIKYYNMETVCPIEQFPDRVLGLVTNKRYELNPINREGLIKIIQDCISEVVKN
jgi:hypothetical protein